MIISDNGHAASNYEIDFTNLTHEDPSWPGCDDWGRIRYILQQPTTHLARTEGGALC